MAPDGSVIIDTKIDDSKVPSQLNKLKKMLGGAVAAFAVPAAVTKAIGIIKDLADVAADTGETIGKYNVVFEDLGSGAETMAKRFQDSFNLSEASAKQMLSATGNILQGFGATTEKSAELSVAVNTLGADLASFTNYSGGAVGAAEAVTKAMLGETESLKQMGIVIRQEDVTMRLKEQGQEKLTGAALNLAKAETTLKMITEQAKNSIGDYARTSDSASNITKRAEESNKALASAVGESLSPAVTKVKQIWIGISEALTEVINKNNELRDAEKAIDEGTDTAQDQIRVLENRKKAIENEMATLIAYDELGQKIYTQAYKDKQAEINAIDTQIKSMQILAEYEAKLAKEKTLIKNLTEAEAKADEETASKKKEKTDALIKAYSEWEAAQARANKAAEMGVTTQDEQMQELKRAAQEYQEKLVDITLQYGALGEASTEAFNKAQGITKDPVIPRGSPIGGPVMPTGTSSTTISMILDLIAAANDGGDAAGKALTSSMSSAIDNTSIGVSDSIGAVMDNIGAAITIAIAVVKKIFAGIKAVAKFDPMAMYESFLDIIDGLTSLFDKISTLPIYIKAGKKILFEFAKGMIENREKNAEIFRNVLVYMLETAKEVIPAMITLALLLLTDFAVTIINNLPLILETAFAIIGALAQGILEALPSLLTAAIQVLPMLLTQIITGIPLLIIGLIGALPEVFIAVTEAMINSAYEMILALIQAMIFSFVLYQPLLLLSLVAALVETFLGINKESEDGGKAILEGIKQGIENNWNTFIGSIVNIWDKIIQSFKDAFEINSPSKVFWRFGVNLMDGLKNAILGYDLWGKISGKFTELRGKVSDALSGIKDTVSTVATTVGGVISDGVSDAVDWVKGLFNADGTNNFRGGTAIINEEGAEMVTLPSGSKIMTASATAQMQDRAISQLLAGMKTPTFAVAGSGGNRNINISTKVDAPMIVDGAMLGRLVFQNIDRAVI